jgi:hypothetical protein
MCYLSNRRRGCYLSDETNEKYIYLIVGYAGLLLIGIAILRSLSVSVIQDTLDYALTMFGYIFLMSYFKFADDKIGATKNEKAFFRISLLAILGLVALYLY